MRAKTNTVESLPPNGLAVFFMSVGVIAKEALGATAKPPEAAVYSNTPEKTSGVKYHLFFISASFAALS